MTLCEKCITLCGNYYIMRKLLRYAASHTAVIEVLLLGHGGDGGATAVLVRCHGGHGAVPRRPHCGLAQPTMTLRKF